MQTDALTGAALGLELVAQGKIALIQVAQSAVRGDEAIALLFPDFPLFDGVSQVALEYLCKVMGAKKLVIVAQPDKGGHAVL
ncbi:hypothetical protein D3C84_1024580 [compost metagenome]